MKHLKSLLRESLKFKAYNDRVFIIDCENQERRNAVYQILENVGIQSLKAGSNRKEIIIKISSLWDWAAHRLKV